MLRVAIALSLAGCAAVPHGFGAVALRPENQQTGELRATTGVGVAADRQTFQLDLSFSAAPARWFVFTAGGSYVALSDTRMAPIGSSPAQGFWPWLRPTVCIGPVTIATPLSGFAIAGPEAALWYGIAGLDVGVASTHAALHAGIRWDVAGTLGGPEFSARQLVGGGQYEWDLGRTRLGLSLEGIYGEQHGEGYVGGHGAEDPMAMRYTADESFVMVMLKLTAAWRFSLE